MRRPQQGDYFTISGKKYYVASYSKRNGYIIRRNNCKGDRISHWQEAAVDLAFDNNPASPIRKQDIIILNGLEKAIKRINSEIKRK